MLRYGCSNGEEARSVVVRAAVGQRFQVVRSATEESVDGDADEAAADQERAVEPGLRVGVENRKHQQREQGAI